MLKTGEFSSLAQVSIKTLRYYDEAGLLTWQAFTEGPLSSPNRWTGAYLCVFAHAAQLTLVTFDAKIPPRWDVNCLLLGGSLDVGPAAV